MTAESATTTSDRRHGAFHPLTVAAVEALTADAVAVTFDVPEDRRADYVFRPGQHLTLRTMVAGVEVRRTYSICSSVGSGRLRVAVKRLEGGAFSGHATSALRAGDVIEVMTPTGRFGPVLDPLRSRRCALIAAGSGITPLLSIATSVLEVEPDSSVTLLYGNRTAASVMFLDDLADLKDRFPDRLRVLHVLSREEQEAELLSGRLDAPRLRRLLPALLPPDSVDEWYLCGPFAMVDGVQQVLAELGVTPGRVHTELFHVEGEGPRASVAPDPRSALVGATSSVAVTLDGRVTSVEVPLTGVPPMRILDAVLAVRADAPFACKGGVCGTCRARVVSGEVSMARNYALDDEEVAGGFVLACQSVPVSDVVELDFDA